jgi:hypothetical protein
MQHTTEAAKQYQCRHIFTDGHRCASPCLRGEEFCYYHHTTRKPIANPKQRRSRHSTFHLPLPEDRSAIQSSIGEVLQRIAANDIDPRRAGLLLYGLQIASLNLPKQQNTQRHARPEPVETVEEITIDPTLGVMAPRAEVSGSTKPKSVVAQLIERMVLSENEEEEAANPGSNEIAAAVPAIVPILQATEDDPDIAVLLNPTQPNKNVNATSKDVISTGGGALAAAVEKSAVAFAVCLFSSATQKQKLSFQPEGGRTQPPCQHISQQPFTASIPSASQLQKSKFPNIHTP